MLATQLLRILQTIPDDVEYETWDRDSAEQDMIMKEDQNGTHYDSKSSGRDSDPLPVGSKETYQDTYPSLFEVKDTDEYWNPQFGDDLCMDNKADEFQNGPFCHLDSLEDDIDSLSFDRNAKDEVQTRPVHDHAVEGGEFMYFDENESSDPYASATDLLDYDRPEIIVCYKELNYHVVKDICVDEGMPANIKILVDDQSADSFPHPLNDDIYCKDTGGVDDELLISNGLGAASLDNAEFIVANQQGSEDESSGILLVQASLPELPSDEKSLYKDTATNMEESIEKDGMSSGATSKAATHASDDESFIDKTLPIQEFGTRSFLRSFMNSLDGEESEVQQLPDQFSSGKVVSEGPTAPPTEARPKEDVRTSILNYNSEVETRSITFNFNSVAPVVGGVTDRKTELVKEQSVESREMIDKNDAEANFLSATGQSQSASSNDMNDDNDKSAADSHVLQHEDRDTDNEQVVSLRRYDHGEASFSADDFITHSGPLPFSGNLSLCSDSSATSGRSFAFPELQSEWNSSPVRMTDAERRRFRRHRGWRSGLLGCRF